MLRAALRTARQTSARLAPALRPSVWGIAVTLLSALLYTAMYFGWRSKGAPGQADPHYMWLFTRSLVFDGDVDFVNDFAVCGDPFNHAALRGPIRPSNVYHMGPSVFWIPTLLVVRALVRLPSDAAPAVLAGCRGPWAEISIGIGPIVGALAVWLGYRMARRVAGDGVAALSAALFATGGLLAAYSALQPGYNHVYATFAVSLALLAALRAFECPDLVRRWAAAAAALSLSVFQQPFNVAFALVPAAFAVAAWRQARCRLSVVLPMLGFGVVLGAVPLLLLNRYQLGHALGTAYGRYYVTFDHAHPWLVLFAPHGGLFYLTPIVWLAVVGAALAIRQREGRIVALALVAASAAQVYMFSAVQDWHGSGSFGARRLTALHPIFVYFGSVALAAASSLLSRRPELARGLLGAGLLAVVAPLGLGVMLGAAERRISLAPPGLSQERIFGEGNKTLWALSDRHVGDLFILPAELWFAARYRMAPNRFGDASSSRFYIRNFFNLRFLEQTIPLRDPSVQRATVGLQPASDGLRLIEDRARIVFAAQWPFATKLSVRASSRPEGDFQVGFGTWHGVKWLTPNHDQTTPTLATFAVPAGAFDSGLNELVVECRACVAAGTVLHSIRIDDETQRPPAF